MYVNVTKYLRIQNTAEAFVHLLHVSKYASTILRICRIREDFQNKMSLPAHSVKPISK